MQQRADEVGQIKINLELLTILIMSYYQDLQNDWKAYCSMYPCQQKGVPEKLHSNLCSDTFSAMDFPLPRSLKSDLALRNQLSKQRIQTHMANTG